MVRYEPGVGGAGDHAGPTTEPEPALGAPGQRWAGANTALSQQSSAGYWIPVVWST